MSTDLQIAKAPPGSLALLDPRREAFALAYSETGVGHISAKRAGYGKNLSAWPTKLLNDEDVANRIRWLNAQQFKAIGVSAEKVKLELARVAFASAADLFDADGRLIGIESLSDDAAATITGIDVEVQQKVVKDRDGNPQVEEVVVKKIRRADKMAALGLLARHFKIVGAEDDGVNALATALADRLNAAKRRLEPAREVLDSSDVEDARIIEPTTPTNEPAEQEPQHEQLW